MQTTVFTMCLRSWDIRLQTTFQSKVTKNRACDPNIVFDASNHTHYEKVIPKGCQQATRNPSKIERDQHWDTQGNSWLHPCTQWSLKWCQSGAQRPQNASKMASKTTKYQWLWMQVILKSILNYSDLWIQIYLKNSVLQILQILEVLSDCKLQVCWLPEGPAAGAKP